MIDNFKMLSESEFNQLKEAVSLISVYIAGADGDIDNEEIQWAEKITKIRSYNAPELIRGYYDEVGLDFEEKVLAMVLQLNGDTAKRNAYIEEKLAALNPIMAKLDERVGAKLYTSYITFAKHVAKATGGFLGFFSIGAEEAALLDLKMITPVIYEEEEEVPEKFDDDLY